MAKIYDFKALTSKGEWRRTSKNLQFDDLQFDD